MGEKNRVVVIVARHIELLEPLVEAAGFEVVGAAETAFYGEKIVAHHRPDVIVVENELIGEQGWRSIPCYRDISPGSKIVLVVADGWRPSDVGAVGVFAVLPLSRVGELGDILNELDTWLAVHVVDGTVRTDRRSGRDRREAQDWSKVGWERRSHARRRALVDA